MTVVFDTSAWIDCSRYYPFSQAMFRPIWDHLQTAANSGDLVCPIEVYRELTKKDDDIQRWVSTHVHHAFVEPSVTTVTAMRRLLADHPYYHHTSALHADPWVIAKAIELEATVITSEVRDGKIESVKIPNMCDKMQVPCMNVLEWVRTL